MGNNLSIPDFRGYLVDRSLQLRLAWVITSQRKLCLPLFTHAFFRRQTLYGDIIMSGMASQLIGSFICSTVYSVGEQSTVWSSGEQRNHQSSTSLDLVRGIHRWPVHSPSQRASNMENVSIWWLHHGIGCALVTRPPFSGTFNRYLKDFNN